ncbi:MAG: TonB-dependent receptor [Paludibacter sp.]|jgi:TonB-linked SusC/RagA family outer membrane protein|nr:TonB-dependent receptor [Paludibacter sp.]
MNKQKLFKNKRLYGMFVALSMSCCVLFAQNYQQVSGRLTDTGGEALIGVSVSVKGGTLGVVTNIDGNYTLSNVPSNATLVFSFIGMKTQEVKVNSRSRIDVTLEEDAIGLEEVVAIGYGTVKKRDLTGAVSSVKARDITLAPVINPIEAMQGRVAGLDIARNDGRAGANSSILLRGNRSLTASSNPIYIIDGIQGDINSLNPNDIASIDVLKDASSTAIYGSAGANGVFIITTKQADKGKMQIDFDAYMGINHDGRYPSPLLGDQWLTYLEDGFYATNERHSTNRDELLTAWNLNPAIIGSYIDNNKWINWVDETLRTGIQQNYTLSVRGGTEKIQSYFSLGFNDTQGIYKNDRSQMYTARTGVNIQMLKWMKAGIQTGLTWKDNESRGSRINKTFGTIPLGEVYDENGKIRPYPIDGMSAVSIIADDVEGAYENNSKSVRITANPYLELTPLKGLTFKSILGATLTNSRTGTFNSDHTYMILTGSAADVRNATYATNLGYSYTWENILNYNLVIANDHDITATVVSSWGHNQSESASSYNEGFLYDDFLYYSLSSGVNSSVSSSYSHTKKMSVVGRLNYSYKGKYLLSISNRYDGVSQLSRRWANFPAGAVAWRISEENFMENTREFIGNLKLRLGYGVSGNSGIAAYSTTTEVTSTGLDAINLGGGEVPVSVLTQTVGNEALTWEKSYNFNAGLDFAVLNNRIDGSVEFYDTDTKGVLYRRALPFTGGGFTAKTAYSMTGNIARMHNRGIEVTLNTRNIVSKDFNWTSNFTFARNWEMVKEIDLGSGTKPEDLISLGLFLGNPRNTVYGIKKIGIWQTDEEADAAAFGLKPGDVKTESNLTKVSDGVWVDNTGETPVEYTKDKPYTVGEKDRKIYGQGSPKWTGGMQNTFIWKNLDLNVFVTARWGQTISSSLLGFFGYGASTIPDTYNYWTPENPTNDFPRPYLQRTTNYTSPTTGLSVVDGSYVKIKNITLGYTLPSKWQRKLNLTNFRVYGTMYNPIIITKSHLLRGSDPESGAGDAFPLYRQLVFGVNISL